MKKSIFIDEKCFDLEYAKRKCIKYKYISFDVFDTLIKRNLNKPSDIFILLEEFAKSLNICNFSKIRIESEKSIRQIKSYVTLEDIYKEIGKKVNSEKCRILLKKEEELEYIYCQPNYEIYELYKYLKDNKKIIIATSDMYLSSELINKILKKCNINVDKIFVSCECKAKKTNGTLFEYLIEKINISRDDIIHIGDNYKADVLGAKKNGISSIKIKKNFKKYNVSRFYKEVDNKNSFNVFYQIINNNLIKENTYYKKFGFAVLGPLIYSYCCWLKNRCNELKIEKIFFFARDGYILKQAFDNIFPNEFNTSYVYFSRRAIRIPYSSINPNYENIMKYFPKTKMLTMRVYFENFGLVPEKYENMLGKYDLRLEDIVFYKELMEKEIFKNIFNEIFDDIVEEATKEFKTLNKYIEQEKMNGKIAVVDVGWHNSMQYYLENISNTNNLGLSIYGLYVGKMSPEKGVGFSEGFIHDNNSKYADSALGFIGLIESVFLNMEGSTKSYYIKDGIVYPELLKYEYEKKDLEYSAFKEIQEGINDFINITNKLECLELFCLDGKDAYLSIKSFGLNPYLLDISKFSKFRYFSEEIVYFSNSKHILHYLMHPKKFRFDFYRARWKIGFMKELFKINFPYYWLYKIFKR